MLNAEQSKVRDEIVTKALNKISKAVDEQHDSTNYVSPANDLASLVHILSRL